MARKKRQFNYQKRSKESLAKRAAQQGGMFDSVYKDQYSTFAPKEGEHRIRIMPPTWDNAEHYGMDVYLHSSVGPDNQTYACLKEMKKEACPLCEERARAQKRGDETYANELRPYRRVLMWVIDRTNENEGPVLYPMPWTMDRDITAQSQDKHSGEVLYIDEPEEGYDVDFRRDGSGMKTKYVGIAISRRSTPLADDDDDMDKWLDFITDNPLTEVVNYFDYDHISGVSSGSASSADDDDDDEVVPPSTKRRARAESVDDDLDDDVIDDDDDMIDVEDDDEEEAPPRRRQRVRN